MGMKVLRPLLGSRGPQPAPFAPLRWGARASGECCLSISFVRCPLYWCVQMFRVYIQHHVIFVCNYFPFNFMWGF